MVNFDMCQTLTKSMGCVEVILCNLDHVLNASEMTISLCSDCSASYDRKSCLFICFVRFFSQSSLILTIINISEHICKHVWYFRWGWIGSHYHNILSLYLDFNGKKNILYNNLFLGFSSLLLIGQCRLDRKWTGERDGEWAREMTSARTRTWVLVGTGPVCGVGCCRCHCSTATPNIHFLWFSLYHQFVRWWFKRNVTAQIYILWSTQCQISILCVRCTVGGMCSQYFCWFLTNLVVTLSFQLLLYSNNNLTYNFPPTLSLMIDTFQHSQS